MTTEIPLTQGKVALVDDEDAQHVLAQGKWYARRVRDTDVFYALRKVRRPDGKQGDLMMHAFLTGYKLADHHNGNTLDNRRANLRESTHAENMRNRRKHRNNRSGYIGVYWHTHSGRYRAVVKVNGHIHQIGTFLDPIEAAHARDAAALELHGEFARLNFPLEDS